MFKRKRSLPIIFKRDLRRYFCDYPFTFRLLLGCFPGCFSFICVFESWDRSISKTDYRVSLIYHYTMALSACPFISKNFEPLLFYWQCLKKIKIIFNRKRSLLITFLTIISFLNSYMCREDCFFYVLNFIVWPLQPFPVLFFFPSRHRLFFLFLPLLS